MPTEISERIQTPASITASKIAKLGYTEDQPLEEHKLVERYLKDLDDDRDLELDPDGPLDLSSMQNIMIYNLIEKPKNKRMKIDYHDIFPDDSVSVADRPHVKPHEASISDSYSGIFLIILCL